MARYVFANRSHAELAEKIVRVRVGSHEFFEPITVDRVDNEYDQWVLKVPNLHQDMLFHIAECIAECVEGS